MQHAIGCVLVCVCVCVLYGGQLLWNCQYLYPRQPPCSNSHLSQWIAPPTNSGSLRYCTLSLPPLKQSNTETLLSWGLSSATRKSGAEAGQTEALLLGSQWEAGWRREMQGGWLLKMNGSQTVGSSCLQGKPGSGSKSGNVLLSLLWAGQDSEERNGRAAGGKGDSH